MLNRVIVFILLTCVMGTYLSRDFAVASFELNQRYIAEKLCENRQKPWMNCNGRCYLMKKVKQAEENEKKQANTELRSSLQMVWFFQSAAVRPASPSKEITAQHFKTQYTYHYTNQYTDAIFRPPKSVAAA